MVCSWDSKKAKVVGTEGIKRKMVEAGTRKVPKDRTCKGLVDHGPDFDFMLGEIRNLFIFVDETLYSGVDV